MLLNSKGQKSNFLASVIFSNCTMSICNLDWAFNVCCAVCVAFFIVHMLTTSIKIRLNVTRRGSE